MSPATKTNRRKKLTLQAETSADLMTANPVSIRDTATVAEAVALLTDRGFSAAPVIDQAGRPVGVVSRSDILVHDRERADYVEPVPEYYERSNLSQRLGEPAPEGFQVERTDRALVRDIMTPIVFSVAPASPAARAVEEMLALKVHRLFVVDEQGILVGVISALDILQRLQG
jgi:CBS domain-containing protein